MALDELDGYSMSTYFQSCCSLYYIKQSDGKLTAVFGGGSAAVLRGLLSKNLVPLQALAYLSAKPEPRQKVLEHYRIPFFDFMNPLKEGGSHFWLPLTHSFAAILLHCKPSLSFNLSSTPLLFVLPLSTSQLSSILHSLHCRQICVVVNRLIPPQTNMN